MKSSLVSGQEDKRNMKVHHPHSNTYCTFPYDGFQDFPHLFVTAATYKWCLIKTEEKLVFILTYYSA